MTGKQPRQPNRPRRSKKTSPAGGPMTPATVPVNPADKPLGKPGKNTDRRLDEGLEETFPASDPVSTRIE